MYVFTVRFIPSEGLYGQAEMLSILFVGKRFFPVHFLRFIDRLKTPEPFRVPEFYHHICVNQTPRRFQIVDIPLKILSLVNTGSPFAIAVPISTPNHSA